MKEPSFYLSLLSQLLPEKRLQHSIRVAQTAEKLAFFWKLNEDHAYVAGLLHDAAKYLNPTSWLEQGLIEPAFSRNLYETYPSVWHAYVVPILMKNKFGVRHPDILSAAKWHTTGRASMKPLEQVVFISDFIEPNRPFKERTYIEELAYKNLDQATYAVSVVSLLTLIRSGSLIFTKTLQCRDCYLKKNSKSLCSEIVDSILSSQ